MHPWPKKIRPRHIDDYNGFVVRDDPERYLKRDYKRSVSTREFGEDGRIYRDKRVDVLAKRAAYEAEWPDDFAQDNPGASRRMAVEYLTGSFDGWYTKYIDIYSVRSVVTRNALANQFDHIKAMRVIRLRLSHEQMLKQFDTVYDGYKLP